jgi:uncharacterized membrane protein YkvA (DUF1232 family)
VDRAGRRRRRACGARPRPVDVRRLLARPRLLLLPVVRRLPAYSKLAWALIRDRRVRRRDKVLLIGGIGYLFSPIDAIPGLIPLLGQMDDMTVTLWALRSVLRRTDPHVAAEHMAAVGITMAQIDADLAQLGRSASLFARGAAGLGFRLAAGAVRRVAGLAGRLFRRR